MVLAALSSVASFVPFIAIYFVIAGAIDAYPDFASLDVATMMGYGWMAIAGIAAQVGLYLVSLLCSHAAAFDAEYRLKLNFIEHMSRIPLGRLVGLGSGRISKMLDRNTASVQEFIAHTIPDMAATLTAPVAVVVLLFVFDWRFGAAAVVCVVVAFLVQSSGMMNRQMAATMGRYQIVQEEMGNASVEYVRGMTVIKTFGQTTASFAKMSDAIKDYTGLAMDVTMFWRNLMPAFTAIINNAYLFILPVGIILATGVSDWQTFALDFIFYLVFVASLAAVLNKLMYISEGTMLLNASLDRLDEVMEIPPLGDPEGRGAEPGDSSVAFDHVTFSYGEGAGNVLEDVSFSIPAGSTCVLVGPSGAGKSTIANLIARFWDVDEGRVLIGGTDIRNMTQDTLMGSIGLVFQDFHLFKESVLDNIRMARPEATEDEVMRAAKAARADEFIQRLPAGYETVIGSEGIHLSGGERQRISIARAILADTPIVVLDEATSFTDPENEHLIQQAFENLMTEKTVIMIAHRLSTAVGADQVLVIGGGRIVERGTHEELVMGRGMYAEMWSLYAEALNWKIGSEKEEL